MREIPCGVLVGRRVNSRSLSEMTEQAELSRPKGKHRIETVNPATGEPGPGYDEMSLEEARAAAAKAQAAFVGWRRRGFDERSANIHEAAGILRARKDEFARLMTQEMGKTLDEGRAEIEKCAFHCDWFGDHARDYIADQTVDLGGGESF